MSLKGILLLSIQVYLFSCEYTVGQVDYLPPSDIDCSGENIEVRLDSGDILAGTLTYPKSTTKKLPTVVFITGSSAHDRDNGSTKAERYSYRPFRRIAHYLSSNGIATLRVDDRGIGASVGGNITNMNTAERVDDIKQVIRYLEHRTKIDGQRIGLIGLSEGASIAQMIASEDQSIKAIVSMAGMASTGREILKYQADNGLLDGVNINELVTQNRWFSFFNDFDPLKTARMVQIPILILQGKTDRRVPYSDAYLLANTIRENGNDHVTVQVLPNYNHLFIKETLNGHETDYGRIPSLEIPIEVLEIIHRWLVENL